MRKVLRASSESAFDAKWNKVRATSERPLGSEVYWGSQNWGPQDEKTETVQLHRKDESFRILTEINFSDTVKCAECGHLGNSHYRPKDLCADCTNCTGFCDNAGFLDDVTGYHYYLMHYYGIE